MSDSIRGWAAAEAGAPLVERAFEVGPLADGDVELEVMSCGLCHSDLSMIDDAWRTSRYPLVPGHEVVGRVARVGGGVRAVRVGQTVGLGWLAGSCMYCDACLDGDHNLCGASERTIVGRHGGFADRVRCAELWATPLPEGLDPALAGPLFCGGVTVFNPLLQAGVRPTDRVGVIGIGGLGHLALQFARAWGCEVTAFTSHPASKGDEAREMGAHHVVDSTDADALKACAGRLDFILSTVNVALDWRRYAAALRPRGKLHFVGASAAPFGLGVWDLMASQRGVSASPVGSPATTRRMLEFCVRHGIAPLVERYPMAEVNDALRALREGAPRYRIVLDR